MTSREKIEAGLRSLGYEQVGSVWSGPKSYVTVHFDNDDLEATKIKVPGVSMFLTHTVTAYALYLLGEDLGEFPWLTYRSILDLLRESNFNPDDIDWSQL